MTGVTGVPRSTNRPLHGLAIISMVLGAASIVGPGILLLVIVSSAGPYADDMILWMLFGIVALTPAILAVVFGGVAAYVTCRSGAEYGGAMLAWVGMALGAAATIAWTAVTIAGIAQP